MDVLILEDDRLMLELLKTLVLSIDEHTRVWTAETAEEGLSIWRKQPLDLVLSDWNLPGQKSGLDLVREIRKEDAELPIIMVTGQADRSKVISSARLGVNGFISKPFDAEDVISRLRPLFQTQQFELAPKSAELPTFLEWAGRVSDHEQSLEALGDIGSIVNTLNNDDRPNARGLAAQWQSNGTITTRLIRLANSSLMSRSGTSVSTLLDAINNMGVEMALQQVIALTLNEHSQLRDPRLSHYQVEFAQESQAIALQAARLAKQLNEEIALSYTAGLMHRMGESAVLLLAQFYLDQGGRLEDKDISEALKQLSSVYGNMLKIAWQIPQDLRTRIGACHWLSQDEVRRELILMRVAAALAKNEAQSPELSRAMSHLGIST